MTETSWLSAACLGEVVASPVERQRRRWGLGPGWHGSLVFARCEHDVVAAVRTATRSGTEVLARSGPHRGTTAGGSEIVVVTAGLDHVDVDPVARTARVGVGATWRDVARAAAAAGLAPVAGDDPDAAVGADVLAGADGPWCRSLGPVAGAVEAADVVSADGRLLTLAGPAALGGDLPGDPPVLTSLLLRLVPAAPVTVIRCRDARTPAATSVWRWLDAAADLPVDAASAVVVPGRHGSPVTWWLAVRGPGHAPAGWLDDDDAEVTRRPAGALLRWPPTVGRGPVECVTVDQLPAVGHRAVAEAVTADRRGAVVLRHRGSRADGPWLDVLARPAAAARVRAALAGSVGVGVLPDVGSRP